MITRRKKFLTIIICALLGFLSFLLINTAASLKVTDDSFILGGYVERDIIQHYTGWLFYRDSHISFPLGVAENISYPSGGAIAFSDSLPLVSVVFGCFSALLPQTFQFFGIYSLLCYVLMGISSAMLLFLFFDSPFYVILGSIPFIVSPVMIERAFRHTALASHYLIVFALYIYFLNRREGYKFRFGYPVLCFLATAIHFYFVPMILAVVFADLLSSCIKTRKLIKNFLFLLTNISVVFLTAFLFGYFHTGTVASGVLGYGYFTMNLNSLFNPVSISGIRWSFLLPALGQGLGSAEGFNYLGLGMLSAIVIITVYLIFSKKIRLIFLTIKRHLPLFAVSLILSFFAISTTVVINNNAYLHITLPYSLLRLFSVFRSSGRLFWVVYYLIFLFVLLILIKMLPKRLPGYILSLLVIIQLTDLFPAFLAKRQVFKDNTPAFSNPADNSFFVENKDVFNEIYTFSDNGVYLGLYFVHYAIENDLLTNEPFMARNDILSYKNSNDEQFNKLMSGETDGSKLYLFGDINRFFDAAVTLDKKAVSGRIPFEDTYYYIIAPENKELVIPEDSGFTALEDIPLSIADYSDLTWTKGVLNDNLSVVSFYDNAFTSKYLKEASFILCEGKEIKILNKNYQDAGWVMITLDITDGRELIGKPLETK